VWLFMYLCYLLNALSFVLLAAVGLQGYFHFWEDHVSHPTLAIMSIIVYLAAQTLIMFFFVGTGVSIKEYSQEHELEPTFHRRSIALKRRLYPPLLLNILLVSVAFLLGGAVHTEMLPAWTHGLLFWIAIAHFGKTILIQHHCFKENTQTVLEMAGQPSGSATTGASNRERRE